MKPDIEPNDIEREHTNLCSRRRFVGGMATGIIAASATPVFGQPKTTRQVLDQTVKQNPVSQYPKPPFRRQSQEWPGLAGKMTPCPDHGEKSYKGSGRLTGRKALITGGDSPASGVRQQSPTPAKVPMSRLTICPQKSRMPSR
ncbi:MAG TPA: hypothetical protein VIF37_13885 [Methylobacter sp.]|jgi:hypothetical protein